jgi:predicted alpha/beta hydrolase
LGIGGSLFRRRLSDQHFASIAVCNALGEAIPTVFFKRFAYMRSKKGFTLIELLNRGRHQTWTGTETHLLSGKTCSNATGVIVCV